MIIQRDNTPEQSPDRRTIFERRQLVEASAAEFTTRLYASFSAEWVNTPAARTGTSINTDDKRPLTGAAGAINATVAAEQDQHIQAAQLGVQEAFNELSA